jgi:small conductance mechanosensitive channel
MEPHLKEAWAVLARFGASYGLEIAGALIILVVGWILARWVGRLTRRVAERSEALGATLAPIFAKVARISVTAVAVVAALNKLGVDTTSIIAALGAMGLAIGLALKDTLTDIAGGIEVLVLRPFEVGEDVEVDGSEGTVTAIDIFETKLVGFDSVPIHIPNRKVRASRIRNYSRAAHRRVDLVTGVAYEENVDAAIEVIKGVMAADERVRKEPEPIINVTELADSSVNIVSRVWLDPNGWIVTHWDLRRKIKLALDDADITIPFPQRDVHMIDTTPEANAA